MVERGLRNRGNKPLYWKMLYRLFKSPFYYGHMMFGGIIYPGAHDPLISKSTYDRVQLVLSDKRHKIKRRYHYLMQGMVRCALCGKIMRSLTAKKTYQYFFCRKEDCLYKNLAKQTDVEDCFVKNLDAISFKDAEVEEFKNELKNMRSGIFKSKQEESKAIDFELNKLEQRKNSLLDKHIDNQISEGDYRSKQNEIVVNLALLKEKRAALETADAKIFTYFEELGKLLKNPVELYKLANFEQRRKFVRSMVENFLWDGKKLSVVWKKPFDLVAERTFSNVSGSGES